VLCLETFARNHTFVTAWKTVLVFLSFLCVACAGASCQETGTGPGLVESDALLTISKRVDEVRLVFTVTEPNGKFVTALKERDFRLLDNDLPPERVYHFQAHTDLPLQIVLLVDISSSIRYRFPFEQKAASMLLKRVLRPGIDQASVIAFGTDVQEIQSMTNDVQRLNSAVNRLVPGGDTSLYDALILASQKLRSASSPSVARRVIILLTDGADTTSHSTLKQSVSSTILSEATVLVVDATVPTENGTKGQAFLQELTTSSGGAILSARHNAELKGAFQMIEKVLRNQYSLSYKPSNFQTDGSYRSVQLTAQRHHWIVRCRNGYYAK
jgi:VWFA-related protein